MLSLLHIENIALIDRADISFGPGFNVLTGETGAGKSIIIDAIGAVLGERTSRDLIRTGEKSALVTALFQNLPNLPWFQENGVGPDENGELVISRKIQGDGKNLCRVGGVPCTVLQLKALGAQLIDIHGQHDGQQLLDETCHLGYLDSFGGLEEVREAYREEYDRLDHIRRQIASLQMDEAEKARRMENLTFQIQEIQRAELKPGEDQELEEKRKLMRSGEKLMTALSEATAALYGGDDTDGAVSMISGAQHALGMVADVSDAIGEAYQQVTELSYSVVDAAERVMRALFANRSRITTTKMRGFLTLVNDIYNVENLRTEAKLSAESKLKLMRLQVRMVYDAGRERDVKDFVEQAKLLEYLKGVGNSREAMIQFAHYVEALVAYHRYLEAGITDVRKNCDPLRVESSDRHAHRRFRRVFRNRRGGQPRGARSDDAEAHSARQQPQGQAAHAAGAQPVPEYQPNAGL